MLIFLSCLAVLGTAYKAILSPRGTIAGHGVQMECNREKAVEILGQQLQGLEEAISAAGAELQVA